MSLFHKFSILVIFSLTVFTSLGFAAPIKNLPIQIIQPDKEIINCFVSGDEYFNYIHDVDNYIIVKNEITGYYCYAIQQNSEFVPSKYIVGKDTPNNKGLANNIDYGKIAILSKKQKLQKNFMSESVKSPAKGGINNIVVFIRFAGEGEFNQGIEYYDLMFNNTTLNTNSMYNYYKEVSFNQLEITSTFYPLPNTQVVSYQDSHPRAYYQPGGTIGYQNDDESTQREHILLKNAINHIAGLVPSNLIIDSDNDGYVDNVCFIISGSPTGWSSLLWPHMWYLYTQSAYINGKRVGTYNFQLQNSLNSSSVGVLCHEMFHSLGAPDLYHYSSSGISPVGTWDIMENDLNPPQHMGAHMKYKYGKWIDSIPTISSDGEYYLNPLTNPTDNCYKIISPKSTNEYFVIEYRKKHTIFENSLTGEGLLVYRIDRRYDGNADGPPDEVFLFRPNGSVTSGGQISNANLSANVGRTLINSAANPSVYLANGTPGGLNIYDIGYSDDRISFKVHIENSVMALYPNGNENFVKDQNISIKWENFGGLTNYNLKYSYDGGENWNIIAENINSSIKSFNWTIPDIVSFNCKIRVESSSNPSVYDESDATFNISPEGIFNISMLSFLKVNGFTNSLSIIGNKAYVCSKSGGLHIVDISDPNNLSYLGGYNTSGSAQRVKIVENFAFVADETKGVKIFNIADPANIELIKELVISGQTLSTDVYDNFLFVANKENGIRVFDVSDMNNPIEKGLVQTAGNARFIKIFNGYLFIAEELFGVSIYDITDKANPSKIGSVDTPGWAYSFSIKENYLYLADYSGGLSIVNISDIRNPFIVNTINSIGNVDAVSIHNNYLYVATESNGIRMFDISDISNLIPIGYYSTDIYAVDVETNGKLIYVADRSKGIVILNNDLITNVETEDIIPNQLYLEQNYPNPFNPNTKIRFYIPEQGLISLKFYNVLGELIQEYSNNYMNSGMHEYNFNGNNISSGVYLYSIQFNNKILTKKMLLIK